MRRARRRPRDRCRGARRGSSISSSAIGVRTQPGQTQFARTPSRPVVDSDALREHRRGRPSRRSTRATTGSRAGRPSEEMVTIEPRRSTRSGRSRRAQTRKAPGQVDAQNVVPRGGVEVVERCPPRPMPALQTSDVEPRRSASTVCDTARAASAGVTGVARRPRARRVSAATCSSGACRRPVTADRRSRPLRAAARPRRRCPVPPPGDERRPAHARRRARS